MSRLHGIGVLVTGTLSPVSIDSSRMQLPDSSTASQFIVQPDEGISRMSPGTRYLLSTDCAVPSLPTTVAESVLVTVRYRASWFCGRGKQGVVSIRRVICEQLGFVFRNSFGVFFLRFSIFITKFMPR